MSEISGDSGQRYAVQVFVDKEEGSFSAGWHDMAYANKLDSVEIIASSFIKRPNWSKTRIVDRQHPSGDPTTVVANYSKKKE